MSNRACEKLGTAGISAEFDLEKPPTGRGFHVAPLSTSRDTSSQHRGRDRWSSSLGPLSVTLTLWLFEFWHERKPGGTCERSPHKNRMLGAGLAAGVAAGAETIEGVHAPHQRYDTSVMDRIRQNARSIA